MPPQIVGLDTYSHGNVQGHINYLFYNQVVTDAAVAVQVFSNRLQQLNACYVGTQWVNQHQHFIPTPCPTQCSCCPLYLSGEIPHDDVGIVLSRNGTLQFFAESMRGQQFGFRQGFRRSPCLSRQRIMGLERPATLPGLTKDNVGNGVSTNVPSDAVAYP